MKKCNCGCGAKVNGDWKLGHNPKHQNGPKKTKKKLEETDFSALEIGSGVIQFIRKMQDLLKSNDEKIKILKAKVNELEDSCNKLKNQLDHANNRNDVILKKANGERMRFSMEARP